MSLKAKIEVIIYAAEEPVTIDQIIAVVADEISPVKRVGNQSWDPNEAIRAARRVETSGRPVMRPGRGQPSERCRDVTSAS